MGKEDTTNPNPMENHIKKLIKEELANWEENIKKEDAKEIVQAIIPELETLVSKVIKTHMRAIAEYTLKLIKED